jgi:hypothetical protein
MIKFFLCLFRDRAKRDWLCQMHGFVLSDWQMLSLFSDDAQKWNQVVLLLRQLADGFSGFRTSFSSLSCFLRIRISWESDQIHRASYGICIWIQITSIPFESPVKIKSDIYWYKLGFVKDQAWRPLTP